MGQVDRQESWAGQAPDQTDNLPADPCLIHREILLISFGDGILLLAPNPADFNSGIGQKQT